MSTEKKCEKAEHAYQSAMEMIDQEWLRAGVSREELEQDKQLAQLLDSLVGAGRSLGEILAEWEDKSAEEILREYAAPVTALRSA